jgi:glycine/D-amino acid oxidase-like deaminating enzyme
MQSDILHADFKSEPFWWDAYKPQPMDASITKTTDCVIVGAGYAGLSAAHELARHGRTCIVMDSHEPGFGGSTRNGGQVSGGVNVGKGIIRKPLTNEAAKPFLNEAALAFGHIENLIADNSINCGWHKTGYFTGAWCRSHYAAMTDKSGVLNSEAISDAYLVPRERQREEIDSDFYHGGMVVQRAAHLHPALYFKGLLELAKKAGATIVGNTPVTKLSQRNDGSFDVETSGGTIHARDVVIATNGYTSNLTPSLQRRLVPVGSYMIATEPLPAELIRTLIPNNRSIADTRRVLTYYRYSPDKTRLIFGGRAKFSLSDPVTTAPLVYNLMLERFPQLRGTKMTHAWTGNVAFTFDELPHTGIDSRLHYALGCNGSGVAIMTWLGYQTARRILGYGDGLSAFERSTFPTLPFYSGTPWFLPLVGAGFRLADWYDRRFR